MRTPGNTFRSELTSELAKMRSMSLTQKISYIFTYYKHIFVIILIVAGVGYYIGDVIIQAGKEVVLEGFFTNDEWDLFNSSRLEQDYRSYFHPENKQTVYFDDSLYIDLEGSATEYTAASSGKVLAYIANKELDFMVTTTELFDYYSGSIPMCDLEQLLPDDLLNELSGALLYASQDGDSAPKAYGIDLTACRYVTGVGAHLEPLVTDTYCLFIIQSAPHKQAAVDYIRFLFDWE